MATIAIQYTRPGAVSQDMPKVRATAKTVVICGSGRCLWDDLTALGPIDADLMAVNYAGIFLHKPLHWVSVHAEDFQWMLPLRMTKVVAPQGLLCERIETHSYRSCVGVLHVWPKLIMNPSNGSSSICAVRVALAMGYERAILAGVPLDGTGHFYDPPQNLWPQRLDDFSCFDDPWRQAAKHEFGGRVRSMSGLTRDILGPP